jgi:hypothetical protein
VEAARTEVTLSDGQKAKVKRLGLFEIDDIPKNIPSGYTYTIHLFGGDQYEMAYDIEAALENPPVKPALPLEEATPGEPEYYQWQDWLRYQEALIYQSTVYEAYADYCERVAEYIRSECFEGEIETIEDWEIIYNAALTPQVTIGEIRDAMTNTFGARYKGQDIFSSLEGIEGGHGEYVAAKVWEAELMIKLGEREEVYTERSVKERARLIAALKIPEFLKVLENERMIKEMRSGEAQTGAVDGSQAAP